MAWFSCRSPVGICLVFLAVWNGLATLNFLTSLLKEPTAKQRSSSTAHQIWSALLENRNTWQKVLNQKERKQFFCVSVCPSQLFKKLENLTKFAMHVVPMVTTLNWQVANSDLSIKSHSSPFWTTVRWETLCRGWRWAAVSGGEIPFGHQKAEYGNTL